VVDCGGCVVDVWYFVPYVYWVVVDVVDYFRYNTHMNINHTVSIFG